MRTMSLSDPGDSTNEISLEELFANSVADDFSSIINKKLAKSGYFSLFNSEIKWNIRENL